MLIAIVGTALCLIAKRVTLFKRKTEVIDKTDKLYVTLVLLGVSFILIGMVVIALPIEATFFVG